jgi:uncharacterized protein
MSRGPFAPSAAQLPTVLPVFPLTGAVLLPYGRLPLNIFEPRYLDLVLDALAQRRMFGMVQPRREGESGLYEVGCAGRIVHFDETEDGRFLIALEGVCRFRIVEELTTVRAYRQVRVDWSPFLNDLDEPPANCSDALPAFLDAARRLLAAQGLGLDADVGPGLDAGTLIDLLAMQLPLEPADKQAVLETTQAADRAQVILTLLRMRTAEAGPRETRH